MLDEVRLYDLYINDINELFINELQNSLLIHEQKLNQQDKEERDLRVYLIIVFYLTKRWTRKRNELLILKEKKIKYDSNHSIFYKSKLVDKL